MKKPTTGAGKLSYNQKYGIASTLCCLNLADTLSDMDRRFKESPEIWGLELTDAAKAFAKLIAPFYRLKQYKAGFVPPQVMKYVNLW